MIDQTLSQALQKEIPILTAQIRSLYAEFDKKFHLNGAKIPITFGMEPDLLGSYTRGSCHEKEHFHFSLLFIGYAVKNPLKKEDRLDLYKHEYAHYMQYNFHIPSEYHHHHRNPALHVLQKCVDHSDDHCPDTCKLFCGEIHLLPFLPDVPCAE